MTTKISLGGDWWHWSQRGANTWSNLAYPLAGWGLAAILHFHPWAMSFALSMTALGVGSGVYHWFGGEDLRAADWFGMFAVFGTLLVLGAEPHTDTATALLLVLLVGVLSAAMVGAGLVGADSMLGAGLVLGLLPAVFTGGVALGLAGIALLLFLIAKVFHNENNHAEGASASRGAARYGHAMWHGLTALAFDAMFLSLYVLNLNGGM